MRKRGRWLRKREDVFERDVGWGVGCGCGGGPQKHEKAIEAHMENTRTKWVDTCNERRTETDRQAGRQAVSQAGTQTNAQTDKQRQRELDRRQTHRHTEIVNGQEPLLLTCC